MQQWELILKQEKKPKHKEVNENRIFLGGHQIKIWICYQNNNKNKNNNKCTNVSCTGEIELAHTHSNQWYRKIIVSGQAILFGIKIWNF